MDTSLLLLASLTVIDVILFQQVFVYFLQDLIKLQKCQDSGCDKAQGPETTLSHRFLVLLSVLNVLISLINLGFIYITRRRQGHGHKDNISLLCVTLPVIRDVHRIWSIFKIIFAFILLLGLISSGVDWSSLIVILFMSLGECHILPDTLHKTAFRIPNCEFQVEL